MSIDSKILMIIDDDKDDRFFFCNAVKQIARGWICKEAKDGKDGLEQLRKMKQLPDFIFLDLNMPSMNGKECLVELKRDKRLNEIPVIMYSTSNYDEDVKVTRQLGAVYYLVKEIDISKLHQNITVAMKVAEDLSAISKTSFKA
jgi:CheY-like chemotaxis protein